MWRPLPGKNEFDTPALGELRTSFDFSIDQTLAIKCIQSLPFRKLGASFSHSVT